MSGCRVRLTLYELLGELFKRATKSLLGQIPQQPSILPPGLAYYLIYERSFSFYSVTLGLRPECTNLGEKIHHQMIAHHDLMGLVYLKKTLSSVRKRHGIHYFNHKGKKQFTFRVIRRNLGMGKTDPKIHRVGGEN